MKSVVFFNNKGGVGKTTLLCNLAAYLSLEKNMKILVVDVDPQCNSTTYMLTENVLNTLYNKQERETIEAFIAPVRKGQGFINNRIKPLESTRFGCDIIPGDPRLALSEDLLATDWKSAISGEHRGLQTTLMFKHLTFLYKEYDYIFFDVGPSLGAINRSIMLASDYFIIPMSVDVFSLMALENIKLSLDKWKDGFEAGLIQYKKNETKDYRIGDEVIDWQLGFAGYVMQQYKAKTKEGKRQPVNAYEKISNQIPEKIHTEISNNFIPTRVNIREMLGEIQNLHSLVPMSQTSKSPIFALKSADGVVGSHFSKVDEAKKIYSNIANQMIKNIEAYQ